MLYEVITIFAQNKDQNLYDGTVAFDQKKYIDAEADFRVSQSNNASYNFV